MNDEYKLKGTGYISHINIFLKFCQHPLVNTIFAVKNMNCNIKSDILFDKSIYLFIEDQPLIVCDLFKEIHMLFKNIFYVRPYNISCHYYNPLLVSYKVSNFEYKILRFLQQPRCLYI